MNVNNIILNSHSTQVKTHSAATTTTVTSTTNLTPTPQSKHNHYYNNKHSDHYYSDTSRSRPRSMTNSFDMSAIAGELPPNTGPPGTVSISHTNGSNSTSSSSTTNKNLSHVPCKFFKQGICQAGNSCPFSHNLDGSLAADKLPCKYFQKGNCKFGLKCALAHFLPDGTRVNSKNLLNYGNGQYSNGNGSRQTRRSSSFNFNLNSQNSTLLEANDSISFNNTPVGTSPTNLQVSNSNNFATFINIGNNLQQQQQQQAKAQLQATSPPQQQPISLQPQQTFVSQSNQFMNQSNSIASQESNYFPPQPTHSRQNSQSQFQFAPNGFSQPGPPLQMQRQSNQLQQQPFLFGSNSYSGAFGPTTNSTSTNSALPRSYSTDYSISTTSPPQTMFGNIFANGPQSTSASSTTTRYSLGSRLTTPSSTSTTSYFFQDTSAIVDDDDDYQDDLSKFEEDFVPQSLSDVILTPQELQRRDSRSQSGTLSVRPKMNSLMGNPNEGLDARNVNLHRDPFKKDVKIGTHQDDVFLME